MTLILSYISRDFVLQISDQLLVARDGNSWRALREPAVKCVLVDGRSVFASTGLARLPRSLAAQRGRDLPAATVPANQWLAEVLALPEDPREVPERLREEVSEAYTRLRGVPSDLMQQAFMGVGWFSVDGGALEPVSVKVTNMNPARTFEVIGIRLDPTAYANLDANRPLDTRSLIVPLRRLRECVSRRLGPKPVARTLIDIARGIAQMDETVGEDLILSCVPKNQVDLSLRGKQWLLEQGEPSLNGVSFQHIPSGSKAGKTFSPTLVLGGLLANQTQIGEGGLHVNTLLPGDLSD